MSTLTDLQASINSDAVLEGLARLHVVERTASPDSADRGFASRLLELHGHRPIAHFAWRQIDTCQAEKLACDLLAQDLAYSAPLLSGRKAEWIAAQLCASLDPYETIFLASGTVEPDFKKWEPLGAASFEIALVGMDKLNAFLLLATAED